MTAHAVTIHANGNNLASLQADAVNQLATYLGALESAREIAELLIGQTNIDAEATARTLDGAVTYFAADVTVRFTTSELAQLIQHHR